MRRCLHKNLGPRAQRAQLRGGVLWLGLALGLGFGLVEASLVGSYGWVLAFPMAIGSYTMISGLFGVCVFAGARGARLADYGPESIADCGLRRTLRTRGAGVLLASLGWAALLTALFVISA
jgi:hypothetical protein